MGKYEMSLGLQSFTFYRAYKTHETLIEAAKKCGFTAIEMYGKHLALDTCDDPAAVVKQYEDAGLKISGFGVHGFSTDEAAARRIFDFAKVAGIKAISTSCGDRQAAPDVFKMLERLGDEYDINCALHNHGRKQWHGYVWAMEDVIASTSPRIGLCLDTAWLIDVQADCVGTFEKLRARVYGVHIKDFVFDRAGKKQDVVVGTGNLDLDAFVKALVDADFGGYVTLEFGTSEPDPVPSTIQCVQNIKASLEKAGATLAGA